MLYSEQDCFWIYIKDNTLVSAGKDIKSWTEHYIHIEKMKKFQKQKIVLLVLDM
jgi:hypothetical protein